MAQRTDHEGKSSAVENRKPSSGEVWTLNGPREKHILPEVIVFNTCGDVAEVFECTRNFGVGRRWYKVRGYDTTGLQRETYANLHPVRVPVSRFGRRVGKLSWKDRNILMFRAD